MVQVHFHLQHTPNRIRFPNTQGRACQSPYVRDRIRAATHARDALDLEHPDCHIGKNELP